MSSKDGVSGFVKSRVATIKSLFAIPPRSESMAGVIIVYVFTNSIATSVWMFNAWTPYIYLLFNRSNWYVGLMSAVNGVFELSTAFISGYLADKVFGPSKTLRFAVVLGLVTLVVVLIGIWTEQTKILVLAQMLEGTYMGFSFTCLESVFAQCMRKGERDRLYSIKFSFEAAGPIVGLLLTITLFFIVGDEWRMPLLRQVMTAGVAVHLGSMVTFLATFEPLPSHLDHRPGVVPASPVRDKTEAGGYHGKASDVAIVLAGGGTAGERYEYEDPRLPPPDEADESELPPLHLSRTAEMINEARTAMLQVRDLQPRLGAGLEPSISTGRDGFRGGTARDADGVESVFSGGAVASTRFAGEETCSEPAGSVRPREEGTSADPSVRPIIGYADVEYEEAPRWRQRVMRFIPLRVYPVLVVASDLILVIGSGMTTQYFGLFMMNIYGVSPILLGVLNLTNSFIISSLAILNGVLGKRFGRSRIIVPPRLIGSLILLYMALARDRPATDGVVHASSVKRVVMCICYVVRNALMNCTAGLSRALIMDLVSETHRGRWNALESVQAAGWSGTALLGGELADRFGYGAAFIITFCFHLSACVMLVPLGVRNDTRLPTPIYGVPLAGANDAKAVGEDAEGRGEDGENPRGESTASSVSGEGTRRPRVAKLTVENVQRIASSAMLAGDGPVRASGGVNRDEAEASSAAASSPDVK